MKGVGCMVQGVGRRVYGVGCRAHGVGVPRMKPPNARRGTCASDLTCKYFGPINLVSIKSTARLIQYYLKRSFGVVNFLAVSLQI